MEEWPSQEPKPSLLHRLGFWRTPSGSSRPTTSGATGQHIFRLELGVNCLPIALLACLSCAVALPACAHITLWSSHGVLNGNAMLQEAAAGKLRTERLAENRVLRKRPP